jgi:hypothetical protein
MANGRRTGAGPALREIRELFRDDFPGLEDRFKALLDPPQFPVSLSPRLQRLTAEVQGEILGVPPPAFT